MHIFMKTLKDYLLVVIGTFFGLKMHFKVVRMADEILEQIRDLQE